MSCLQKKYYPKAYLCDCQSGDLESYEFSGFGTLVSFTQITVPPAAFESLAPYCIGLIALDEGPKMLAQLTDVDLGELKIGMKMQACLRKMYVSGDKGVIHYGLKFVVL